MEDDPERPYSVYAKDVLIEKMDEQINAISEIFWVSKPDATVLLMKLRWDSKVVSERLSKDKKKLLTESGLQSVVSHSSRCLSDSSCDVFYDFYDDVDDGHDDDDSKISTPFCSHKFSATYWSKYLEKSFFSVGKSLATISCPHHDCGAAVGRDTIEKLTVKDIDRYDGYVLRSYLEQESMIKQCPAPGCSYVIEFHRGIDVEEYGLNVVCLCGHIFCWRCSLESHRPVTCNNASDWLSRDLRKLSELSLSDSWIESNTNPCPHCHIPVEISHGSPYRRFLLCAHCRGYFCWKCMHSKESHLDTELGLYKRCVKPVTEQNPVGNGSEVDISCVDRWEAGESAMMEAKSELEAFEKSNIMMSEGYIRSTRERLMLIVQCRQFLKWSCVYEYLHTEYEASKKEFMRFLQDYANTLVQNYSESLKEETEKALSSPTLDEISFSSGNLYSATSSIGNYFYHFIKALQDGLDVVEVKHYDDFSSGPYWLCDRCTYANAWLHKVCQMCYESSLN